MSAELWRVLHDLQVAFVAVTCSHVSASVVELLMPQYSADRNKALQMVEGMLGVGFHWMLGVQLFRMLVPLASTNFPGTVFTVFAPMLLRHQYTKLLVAVQSLAGQTLRLLPTMLGDDRGPVDKTRRARGTAVQPLTPDMSQWQDALDDLEKSILTEMRSVLAEAQAAYVEGNKERLEKEEQLLRDVFNEGVADLTSLVQQGNAIGAELLQMAKARQNAVQQWQVQEKWQAFKKRAEQMASEVAIQLTAIEQSIAQMKAALIPILVYSKNASNAADEWRKGGPPVIIDDNPPPADPSDPKPYKQDYPYPTGSGQNAGWVIGEPTDGWNTLMDRMTTLSLVSTDKCGQYHYQDPLPIVYLYDPQSGHLTEWKNLPLWREGTIAGGLIEDYKSGFVVVQSHENRDGKCWYPQDSNDCLVAQRDTPSQWIKAPQHPARFGEWTPRQALITRFPYMRDSKGNSGDGNFLYNNEPFVS